MINDDPLVQDVLSAVRRGLVLPAEYPEAVPLRVGHAQGLYSVWETTEPQWQHWRRPNLLTAQGGFPDSGKGLYIVGVEQGVKIPVTAVADVCRWCSGDGLHPFLSERWRQVLRNGVPLAAGRRYAPADRFELAIGVSSMTWSLLHYLWVAAGQALDPLAMYGLEFQAVRCPRCGGDGGRSFDWTPVSVAV